MRLGRNALAANKIVPRSITEPRVDNHSLSDVEVDLADLVV